MLAISLTGFFNTIILLGSVQGFIISILLFFSKKNRSPNRILSGLIMLITLASFNLYGNSQDWFHSPQLRFIAELVPMVMVMPMGPLIWFYVQSSLDPSFKIREKQKLHFLPIIIDWVPSITAIIYIIGILTHSIRNNPSPWGIFIDDYNTYSDIPRWISVTFYVALSAKYLSNYKLKNNGILNGQSLHFRWLQQFIRVFMVFQVIWLVYLIPYVIPRYTDFMLDTFDWYPVYIPMAVLIYWLGIKGYVVSQQQVIDKRAGTTSTALSPEFVKQVIASLTKAMETDKVYLNPALNLAVMAEATSFSPKIISAVLNQHLQKSFNEFVNGYRVEAFKEKICLPGMEQLTIAGVAAECGFNSQATFQRTFKDITGIAPSVYRKSVVNIG